MYAERYAQKKIPLTAHFSLTEEHDEPAPSANPRCRSEWLNYLPRLEMLALFNGETRGMLPAFGKIVQEGVEGRAIFVQPYLISILPPLT